MKKKLLVLGMVLVCSCFSFAGLQLVSSISQFNTKVSKGGNVIFEQGGPVDMYVDLSYYTQREHYLRNTNSITLSADREHIRNNNFTNSVGWSANYIFDYSSAITFKADDNGVGQQAIIVSVGDLYLNGAQLEREQDGTYIVPTSQNLIATFAMSRTTGSSSSTVYAYRETAPLTNTTQDIYLQGYILPIPEPATLGLLGLGTIVNLIKRRKQYV